MLPGPSERGWGWSGVPDGNVSLPGLQSWLHQSLDGPARLPEETHYPGASTP